MTNKDVSVVIPTHNRAPEIYRKSLTLLSDQRVGELIVVIDGSKDDTLTRLQSIQDPRLKLIVNIEATGPSRARNAGIRHATRPWVALLDDDDLNSAGFLDELVAVAQESGAGVVGAPWIHLAPGESPEEGFACAERGESGPSVLSSSIVPVDTWVQSIWVVPNVVIRRSVLDSVRFNEGYLGNFWREESDFFVSVVRAGFHVVATNRAYSYQYEKPPGGVNRSNRLAYEFWVIRNDIRFMLRHGLWMRQQGYIPSIGSFLRTSVGRRIRPRLRRLIDTLVGRSQ